MGSVPPAYFYRRDAHVFITNFISSSRKSATADAAGSDSINNNKTRRFINKERPEWNLFRALFLRWFATSRSFSCRLMIDDDSQESLPKVWRMLTPDAYKSPSMQIDLLIELKYSSISTLLIAPNCTNQSKWFNSNASDPLKAYWFLLFEYRWRRRITPINTRVQ